MLFGKLNLINTSMYSTVIIEAEYKSMSILYTYFNKENKIRIIGTFSSVSNALPFIRKNNPKIVVLDIYLLEKHGTKLLTQFQTTNNKPEIVLTSYFYDNTLKYYCKEVFDYLLKPVSSEDIKSLIHKISKAGSVQFNTL